MKRVKSKPQSVCVVPPYGQIFEAIYYFCLFLCVLSLLLLLNILLHIVFEHICETSFRFSSFIQCAISYEGNHNASTYVCF